MMLKDLIRILRTYELDSVVPFGFENPHSYRGVYSKLAFAPVENTSVREMLKCARKANGSTYRGYKGGEFLMAENTDCFLAYYGRCGEEIGPWFLSLMLKDCKKKEKKIKNLNCSKKS